MIPLLAFAATIQLECKDVNTIMNTLDRVEIVRLTNVQRKEIVETLHAFTDAEKCEEKDI